MYSVAGEVVLFACLTFLPGTMISATMGVGSLVLAGFADPAKCASIWLTWWLGDVGGQMLVTPFIVLWSKTSLKEMRQSCSAWPCCWGLRSSSNVGARPFIDAGKRCGSTPTSTLRQKPR